MSARYSVVTAFLLLIVSHTVSGQVPTARPDTVASDSTAPHLKPVRITGTAARRSSYAPARSAAALKTNTPLIDVPQAVSIIGRALIRDQSMQGMSDVVRYVPGITMGQGEGNRDQPTIRGNSSTADFFVNGVRDDAQYFRDLYNVERVEAIKGSNALMFGRGGGGGILNRVMKEAEWVPVHDLTLQAGSFDNRRSTLDFGQAFGPLAAGRVNALYENSGLFRNGVTVKRSGVNPTLSLLTPNQKTRATVGYEAFADHRTADRGIPSFAGAPIRGDISTFFGDPAQSYSDVKAHSAVASVTHEAGNGLTLRNQLRFASYRKKYQNVFPGEVTTEGSKVALSAYNNAHDRRNLFNQTDLTYSARTGRALHTLLVGAEIGDQSTDNYRNTGFFNNQSTSTLVSTAQPEVILPVTFRQSASDADNRVRNAVQSLYTQDQVSLSEFVQLVAGVRYERFGIRFHNNRTDSTLRRTDAMFSPRFGVVLKPVSNASLYGGYSVSFLPSAGDQFASLTDVTKALDPEKFQNVEMGLKWDVSDQLALTAATYRLDRTNTRAPAPDNPSLTVQTGHQKSTGYEIGIAGSPTEAWQVAGAIAKQNAVITTTTVNAKAGAKVPLVPARTFTLWNRCQLTPIVGAGLGVVRQSRMFAALNNTVLLPAFTRVDGAVYLHPLPSLTAQINVENILNARYYPLANGNNNITPGSPRAIRLTLSTAM